MPDKRKGTSGTPRAMPYPQHSQDPTIPDIPDNIETLLARNAYQRPPDASRAAPVTSQIDVHTDLPLDLPKHPAFDHRIAGSRSSSKGREVPFSPGGALRERNQSQERSGNLPADSQNMAIGSRDVHINNTTFVMPPLLPELQHLASPPPPPPPPAIPSQYNTEGSAALPATSYNANVRSKLSLETNISPSMIPLPRSALSDPAYSTSPNAHKRGRSGNENFIDKVRNIADRIRSSSRGRDNAVKGPQPENESTPSPYESIPVPAGMALKGVV